MSTLDAGHKKAVTPAHERVANGLALVGIVWFAAALAWGINGPLGGGHYQSMAATGIAGENMWRFHILGPAWSYSHTAPPPSEFYCHHPWGVFWATALSVKLLGHHNLALVLPAVLMSVTTVVLLHRLARSAWGAWGGAAAVLGFVLTPISIAFGHFESLEVITMFGATVFFHGSVRYFETFKKRFLLEALVGIFFATSGDWPGYLIVGAVLAIELLRLVLPSRFGLTALKAHTRWWVLSVALAALMLVFWVAMFSKAGKLADWLTSGDSRSAGASAPLAEVLASRAFWIESAFTPMVIAIGKFAAIIVVIRALVLRKPVEFFALACLFGATVQYVVFKSGADIHYFWPQYYVLYFSLAFAQLVATLGWFVGAVVGRLNRRVGHYAAITTCMLATLVPAVALVPDAPRILRYARATGGRFSEKGHFIRDEFDTIQVAKWMGPAVPQSATFLVDTSNLSWGWHASWALDRVNIAAALPEVGASNASQPWWLARISTLSQSALTNVMSRARPLIIDDLMLVDTRVGQGPLLGYRIEEREPTWLEWAFISGVQPVRSIRENEFVTWEWRIHFDQLFDFPKAEPKDLEEVRVAHNVAVHQGNVAQASKLRARIDGALDRAPAATFSGGHQLLGARVSGKANPKLETWFLSNGPIDSNAYFQVRSTVEAPLKFSLIPRDPSERDCGMPPALPSTVWRVGFIYRFECPMLHRLGLEHFYGNWVAQTAGKNTPGRTDAAPITQLVSIY